MSLYNMAAGVQSATFVFLPMLGKHPDEYPRFRDCFLVDKDHPEYNDHIHVYTRAGGGNRESYIDEINAIRESEDFVADFDDSFDSTYASYVFKVPAKWADDFLLIKQGKASEISEDYKAEMKRVYPKLADKFDEMFSS